MKEWFGFLNSEKLGIAALIVILLAIIIVPRCFRNDEFSPEDVEQLKKEMDVFLAEMENQSVSNKHDTVFIFDPNTIDSASLTLLGFSPRQAKSIVNYRNKGGKFYNKEGFGKSFVVSEEMYTRLYYYIDIKPEPKKFERTEREATKIKEPEDVKENRKPDTDRKLYTIELNQADELELQKFRGIGEYYSTKIVEYRNKLGGFYKAEQLMEIKGIDSIRFAMFSNQILIDTSHIKRMNINTVTESNLAQHPYINNFTAKAIIRYRKFKGTITSGNEMIKERIITEQQMEKLTNYIEY
jgi:DNA uptake protein ComE-like DNA-binding protein